jgi:hypothetical protein
VRRHGQLSRECEFLVRSYVFVRCFTRPPDNLGMPFTPTPQSRIRFAPMKMCGLWHGQYIGALGEKQVGRGGGWGALCPDHRALGLRDQAVLWSEEAPTLMALGGFEQLTLNPRRAEGPGLSLTSQKERRQPAVNSMSCAPRAACFKANPRASAIIKFISFRRTRIGELEGFAKV